MAGDGTDCSRSTSTPWWVASATMEGSTHIAAGEFRSWITQTRNALATGAGADVPCGSCTACCRSSQFILIAPDDPARGFIDERILVPAVGLPRGFSVMGYAANGHCPQLVDDRCTIYEHRPTTCRTYDCRVFPASGIWPDGESKVELTARARKWRFDLSDGGRALLEATQRAGTHLHQNRSQLFGDHPPEPTQLAAMAIAVHTLFLGDDVPSDDELHQALRQTKR